MQRGFDAVGMATRRYAPCRPRCARLVDPPPTEAGGRSLSRRRHSATRLMRALHCVSSSSHPAASRQDQSGLRPLWEGGLPPSQQHPRQVLRRIEGTTLAAIEAANVVLAIAADRFHRSAPIARIGEGCFTPLPEPYPWTKGWPLDPGCHDDRGALNSNLGDDMAVAHQPVEMQRHFSAKARFGHPLPCLREQKRRGIAKSVWRATFSGCDGMAVADA